MAYSLKLLQPLVLKFHMQYDLGFKNDKIQGGRESKMAVNAKNRKSNKINIFSRMADILYEALLGPCF